MKLASFTAGRGLEIGAIVPEADNLIPLSRIMPQIGNDMTKLIARWKDLEADVVRGIETIEMRFPLTTIHLQPPILRPGKVLAMGLNFRDHIAEANMGIPDRPIWFNKQPTSASGPFDPIPLPVVSNEVDYEAEMVAVIGKGGRNIHRADAPQAVFGFCCGNDVSCRDWQNATSQWMLGKSFDRHAPYGPWITTPDEVGDPNHLAIRCFVNGERRQDSNTDQFVFDVWDQIAYVSQVMTLEPGDIIFTGTPGGVGLGRRPRAFLKEGDKVRVEIENLGFIENICREE